MSTKFPLYLCPNLSFCLSTFYLLLFFSATPNTFAFHYSNGWQFVRSWIISFQIPGFQIVTLNFISIVITDFTRKKYNINNYKKHMLNRIYLVMKIMNKLKFANYRFVIRWPKNKWISLVLFYFYFIFGFKVFLRYLVML